MVGKEALTKEIKITNRLEELLKQLNQEPIDTKPIIFDGSFSLVSNLRSCNAVICGYQGRLVVTRNPSIEKWYSVESFVENRDKRSPDFIAQFYRVSDWTHVPSVIYSSTPGNYIRAEVSLTQDFSHTNVAEAWVHIKEKD